MFKKKLRPNAIGLLQALGVVIYIVLISTFLHYTNKFFETTPEIFVMILMLSLLVFSVAVTGSLVFLYPIYLLINKQKKESLIILAYTFLYCLLAILIIGFLVMVI